MKLSTKIKLSSNNVKQYLLDTDRFQNQDLESMTIKLEDNNLIISLEKGYQVIVKQKHDYHNSMITNKIVDEWQLHNFWQSCSDLSHTTLLQSKILYFDQNNSILIYESPQDYFNLKKYYASDKNLPTSIPYSVGITLGRLHRETSNYKKCFDFMNKIVEGELCYQFPYSIYLKERIEPEIFFKVPSEIYKFVALYQRYPSLREAVNELIANHRHYCLTHNNLLFNNIWIPIHWQENLSQDNLSNKNIFKIMNWGSCSWGDPAFDLGTIIADYLLLWLNSLIVHSTIGLDKSLQLAVIPLEDIQPSIFALTKGYISTCSKILEDYPDFIKRVIQFSGLALIYHLLARVNSFQGFNNQSIYILQIAKKMLCSPEEFFTIIFN